MDDQNVIYLHNEYCPVIIKIEILVIAAIWMNLDDLKMKDARHKRPNIVWFHLYDLS